MKRITSPVGLVYWDTGFGVERDVTIVDEIIRSLGYSTRRIRTRVRSDNRERRIKFVMQAWRLLFRLPLQIHFEQIHREQFRMASRNVIVPNPEFTDPDVLSRTPNVSVISCKTRHAFDLLSRYDARCVLNGFTSMDRRAQTVEKDFRRFLHVAGKSEFKGTEQVVEAWRRHPEWPELTIVWSPLCTFGRPRSPLEAPSNVRVVTQFLDDDELLTLQNRCGVHLCPSETEGFGHYINEALSTGAVVVTTDAPPMSEFVTRDHGFVVAALPEGTQFMSTLYKVRIDALETTVERILRTPIESLQAMSHRARTVFETGREHFRTRFGEMVDRLMRQHANVNGDAGGPHSQ